MPPTQKTSTRQAQSTARKGRKPVEDKNAPHGRDEHGEPKTPYGLLPSGKPRRYPERKTSSLDLGIIASAQPVSEEVAEVVKPVRQRSPQQLAMDQVVAEIYREWETAGKPSEWNKLPKRRIDVEPDQVDDLKFLIRKAGDFLKYRVRFGNILQTREGKSVVTFAVMAKTGKNKDAA